MNGGKTDITADHKAVGQQSGIFTGDGGFDLEVGGKTTLIGGAITTTDAAVAAGLNNYTSLGGIETTDIENTTSYKGDAISIRLSAGKERKPSMSGLGYGSDGDSDSSTTKAGITGIAGNSGITTDNRAEYAGALVNAFDAERVNEELGAQTQITQAFDQERRKIKTQLNEDEKSYRDAAKEALENGDRESWEAYSQEADKIQQKSYKGIAKAAMQVAGVVGGALGLTDGIVISESSGTTTSTTDEAVSRLEGQNILVGGNKVTAIGTQFTATQEGGSTYVLGNDIDLGVATSTSTTTETAQKETIGGEGIKLNSDSLQLGAVVRTDTEDTKTTTTGTNQGVTINSDNIVVLGDMTDGSLTTTAAKFNANEDNGSLLIGAKTTVLGGIENTETVTQSNKTDTTRISVDVHHAAVDTISAAEKVKEAGSALAAAKNELSDAKERASRGELSTDAIKDYEINLAAATLNLANAQINLGSVAAGAANTAGTLGFSASANVENTQTKTTDTQTQGKWQGTELNGANATIVGDDFTGVGLKGNIGQLNIDNLGSFNLKAGTNTSSSQSNSKTNSQTGSISTTGSASLGVSTQQSQSQAQGTTYTNSELNVGEFNGYAGTTNLTGGRINAEGGNYATGNLYVETVQNTASSSDKSSGSNLGINFAGGGVSGGSIGANKGSGNSQSLIAAEQSGIVYSGNNHTLTAGSTTNIGGILANINTDSDGNQTNGVLNFTTGTLVTRDLINTATQEQESIGGSLSTGKTATGVSLNNVGLQLGNTGQEFESKTLATFGQGAIVTGDALTGQDNLAGVNRDAFNTEIIIKDMQTGGLAIDTNIDTRVFTSAGRTQIIDEQKELGKNIKTTAAITGTAGLAVPSIAVGLLDKGNSNPDSLNKSGISKAQNNVTQLINNLETGMSDNTVKLAATVEAIQEGKLTNSVDNKDTLNQLNTAITKGTNAEGTQISLVDDLRNVNGDSVQGTTNVINGTDTYLNTDNMGNVVELINHEGAHQNGQGEFAADVIGKTGNSAFNLGKWANSEAIAEERTTITPKPITATNDAKAQQEQLTNDKEKLKAQQDNGDAFEDGKNGYGTSGAGVRGSWGGTEKKQQQDKMDGLMLALNRNMIVGWKRSQHRPEMQYMNGSFLPSGATVQFGANYTSIGDDRVTNNITNNASLELGMHNVIVHGEIDNIDKGVTDNMYVNNLPTNTQQIADAILSNPFYNGKIINLISCHSACNGTAQELSDITGSIVRAPTDRIGIPKGSKGNTPLVIDNDGVYKYFTPKK